MTPPRPTSPRLPRLLAALLAMVVLLTAAAADGGQTASARQQSQEGEAPSTSRIAGADRITTAVAVSQQVHERADVAVLARADDHADALAGVPLAQALDAPLLLTDRGHLPQPVLAELERLAVGEVILLGGPAAISEDVVDALPSDATATRIAAADRVATAVAIADVLAERLVDADRPAPTGAYVVAAGTFPDALAAGAVAAVRGWPVLLVDGGLAPAAADAVADMEEAVVVGGAAAVAPEVEAQLAEAGVERVSRQAGPDRFATAATVHRLAVGAGLVDASQVWLASGADFADALVAGAGSAAVGASLLLVDGRWLEATAEPAQRLREIAPDLTDVVLVGGTAAIGSEAPAQLDALLHGPELPGGGRGLLPDRRLVAHYGSHFSPALGVLGEQPPARAAARMAPQVAAYAELSTRPVLPAFDLIAIIATASAGQDGQYRTRSTDAELQAWLDAAREAGAYLILDLQPGRSDFLTEAQAYERFLREPDVGLALDPEWRVGPDEAPGGGRVGSVGAAEINAVSSWLADIVREEQLPQKLLVIHNFRVDMVTDRDAVLARDGLAINFHMDGQGGRNVKLESYRILAQQPPFHNGFKIFFDEDPDPFQPAEVMALDPVPSFISYQ